MRIRYTSYRLSKLEALSEEQFIALKLYPADVRRGQETALGQATVVTLLRTIGVALFGYLGVLWLSKVENIVDVLLFIGLLLLTLSLFFSIVSYIAFRLHHSYCWWRIRAVGKRHDDFAPFVSDCVRQGLLLSSGDAQRREAEIEGAMQRHAQGYDDDRLRSMISDVTLSAEARTRARDELERRRAARGLRLRFRFRLEVRDGEFLRELVCFCEYRCQISDIHLARLCPDTRPRVSGAIQCAGTPRQGRMMVR